MNFLASIFLTLLFFLTGYARGTGTIGYGYDLAGNLAGAKSSTTGGYDVSYDYDTLNRLTGLNVLKGSAPASGARTGATPVGSSLQSYAYQLNKNGHRTQISELSGRTITNAFDALHRLTAESISVGSTPAPGVPAVASTGVLSYSYDSVGNRQSRTTTGSATLTSLLPDQTQSFPPTDRLTSDTYDANGNTTQSSTGVPPVSSATDTYSFDNKLIRRTTPDGKTIDLTYNPDGHRLAKLIAQGGLTQRLHHYLTDANNPTGYAQVIEEKDPLAGAGGQLRKIHLYGHDLIASLITDHAALITSFYSYDGLGSIRGITDETGELQETYDYDAYGTLIGLAKLNAASGVLDSSDLTNPANMPTSEFLYTGEQWDSDLGMYFLRTRYLNTNTGRFHTQDSYEGRNGEPLTLHKYLYANENPVMYDDPSGMFSLTEMSAVIREQISLLTIRAVNFAKISKAAFEKALVPVVKAWIVLNLYVALTSEKTFFAGIFASYYNYLQLQTFSKHDSLTPRTVKKIFGLMAQTAKATAVATARGIPVSVNGFPDFSNYVHPIMGGVFIPLSGKRKTDELLANTARFLPKPMGYTWHHHEAMGVMILVKNSAHASSHAGGVLFWEICNNKDYN